MGRAAARGAGGGPTMTSTGDRRPHWGRRALGLALIGGLVGWIVAFVGFLVMLQALDEILSDSPCHVTSLGLPSGLVSRRTGGEP